MGTLVYKYRLHAPHENAQLVLDQMHAAHRYRNTLIEIERGRRAAVRDVMANSQTEIIELTRVATEANAVVEGLIEQLRTERAKTRKRSESSDLTKQIVAAKSARKEATRRLREARKALRESPEALAAIELIGERANELRRSARKYCGAFWGSYLLVEDAMQASSKVPLYDADGVSPNDPRFVRWDGEGEIGVQIQGGMSVDRLFSCEDTRLRLEPPPEEAWCTTRSARRALANKATLSLRVGSTPSKGPVWASWVIDMHRPLPKGSIVKWARVTMSRRGPFYEWYVCLTIDTAGVEQVTRPATGGTVAINTGWRLIGADLRVATWRDDDGNHGDLRLSEKVIRALREPDEIRSARDLRFDSIKSAMSAWLKSYTKTPAWLVEVTKNVSQWRSTERMDRVYQQWYASSFHGDPAADAMYDDLSNWYAMNRHLWACEARRSLRAHRHRREIYRIFAAQMANKYAVIVMEGEGQEQKPYDLRPMAVRPVDEVPAQNETARSHRHLVAIGELRGAVKNAVNSRHRELAFESAAFITITCNSCGNVSTRDPSAPVSVRCDACGVEMDQDDNACLNLLARRREREPASDKVTEIGETRWERAKRLRKEKEVRLSSATAE